jgi:phosphoglycolate phosphatase
MRRPTILLFDIDGTLIATGGAGKRAVVRALERFGQDFGRGLADGALGFSFAGMTDRAIIRRGLEASSMPVSEAAIDAILDAYLAALRDEVGLSGAGAFRLLPGVVALLDALEGRPELALGLGTGNVEPGARIKLGHVGLADRFAFGGFGSDAEERAELVRTGALRGAVHLGRPLEDCRVVVIGDTHRDIAAARAIGADCVAVATGPETLDDLVANGPRFAFADLTAPEVLEALLEG